jgi:hypothetical protein
MARGGASVFGTLFCCACSGAAASGGNGGAAAPAPAVAASAAIAPGVPSEPRSHPLRYSAPEGCPAVDGFLGDVESRATTLELDVASDAETNAAPGDEEGVDVRVEPAPDARGWSGRVTIAGPRALEREVRGERCEDVVAALALITVLRLEGSDGSQRGAASPGASAAGAAGASEAGALETGASAPGAAAANAAPSAAPNRSGAASPASDPEPRSPSASPASPSAARPATPAASPSPTPAAPEPIPAEAASAAAAAEREAEESARAPAARAPDESNPPSRADEEDLVARAPRSNEPELPDSIAGDSAESESSPSDARDVAEPEPEAAESGGSWPATSFGLTALGGYAMVPSHAFRAALEGELRLGEGTSAWLTSLSFAYARGDHSRAPSDLGLRLLTLELALCPPAFVAEPSLWLRACASVRGGAVHLAFSATEADVAARDTWRPWLALGAALRAGVPLSERWTLHGVAQLAVQLVRDTYAVGVGPAEDPGAVTVPLYRPEALSLELGAGIGYSF